MKGGGEEREVMGRGGVVARRWRWVRAGYEEGWGQWREVVGGMGVGGERGKVVGMGREKGG